MFFSQNYNFEKNLGSPAYEVMVGFTEKVNFAPGISMSVSGTQITSLFTFYFMRQFS